MNRTVLGAVGALLLTAAGLFWWQGRAELERGAPPPDLGAGGPKAEAPIDLPSADPSHGRGAGLPGAGKSNQGKEERRFNRYDKNRDGRVTRVEMLSTRVKAFQKLDTNHDNLLSFEEWAVKPLQGNRPQRRWHRQPGGNGCLLCRERRQGGGKKGPLPVQPQPGTARAPWQPAAR